MSQEKRVSHTPVTNESSRSGSNRGLITISVILASFLQALDQTIANVALPHMGGELSATQEQISWALAQSNLELSRESYAAGNTGILQVLDAQRQLQQAQLGFVRAQAQQ